MVIEMHSSESEAPLQEVQTTSAPVDVPTPVETDACDILMSLRRSEEPAAQELETRPASEDYDENVAHRKRGRLSIVSSMKMEDISGYFHLNLKDAAAALGISVNTLKRVCRKLNIPKWPYRELKWMDKHRGKMQTYLSQHVQGDRVIAGDTGTTTSSENDDHTDNGSMSTKTDRRKEKSIAETDREDDLSRKSPRPHLHVPNAVKFDQYLPRGPAGAHIPHRPMPHVDRGPFAGPLLPHDSTTRPYVVPEDYSAVQQYAAGMNRGYLPYMAAAQHGFGMGYPHGPQHNYYRDPMEYQRMWNGMVGYMGQGGGIAAPAPPQQSAYSEEYMHGYPGHYSEEQFRLAKRQRRDMRMDYPATMGKEGAAAMYPQGYKPDIPSDMMYPGMSNGYARPGQAQARPPAPLVPPAAAEVDPQAT